ncbi:hypothetical protein KIW84_061959 [Lathyrus oleraceus]|uniref:indole-3-glycerol-phosphate synthase n=1 Tax=Pisum sativum TaxID=3888 RepID=A0A9D4W7C5_PEA|nr:hypothetical protein KIW84_061959 [Pisum sativum]
MGNIIANLRDSLNKILLDVHHTDDGEDGVVLDSHGIQADGESPSALSRADAVLLIAAVLPDLDIKYMVKICKLLGLAALVEMHDEREFNCVLGIESVELIGINNLQNDIAVHQLHNTREKLVNDNLKHFQRKLTELELEAEHLFLARHQLFENDKLRNGNRETLTALREGSDRNK